jgi:hypothetical protein
VDHGEPGHKGDVISFEALASGCTRRDAICKLRQLANLAENGARRLPVNARPRPLEYQHSAKLRPMTLEFLERGSTDDLKRLAALRCLALEPLEMASVAGVLRFATLKGFRAWLVMDQMRFVVEARRLDGRSWEHINVKSWTLPGGNKRWPLGIVEAETCRAIALVEGMPDFSGGVSLDLGRGPRWRCAGRNPRRIDVDSSGRAALFSGEARPHLSALRRRATERLRRSSQVGSATARRWRDR